jgi:lipopolysaccharide/colanic/teichoic acid biosynthesis glycosyltransferase
MRQAVVSSLAVIEDVPRTEEELAGPDASWNLLKKRLFDLIVCLVAMPIWLPVVALLALVNLIASGRPVFYASKRRVFMDKNITMVKFRAMVRNAAQLANRNTIPVGQQRFLNIPADSPLYTPMGRIFEKFQFTELPQLFHVLSGQMSLVGNRPLPENVIQSLRESFPDAEARFLTPTGMTGPTQILGRESLSDGERLRLEALYCRVCRSAYSPVLDLILLVCTVMYVFKLRRFTPDEVEGLLVRFGDEAPVQQAVRPG